MTSIYAPHQIHITFDLNTGETVYEYELVRSTDPREFYSALTDYFERREEFEQEPVPAYFWNAEEIVIPYDRKTPALKKLRELMLARRAEATS